MSKKLPFDACPLRPLTGRIAWLAIATLFAAILLNCTCGSLCTAEMLPNSDTHETVAQTSYCSSCKPVEEPESTPCHSEKGHNCSLADHMEYLPPKTVSVNPLSPVQQIPLCTEHTALFMTAVRCDRNPDILAGILHGPPIWLRFEILQI